jgi:hypothetical protein
VTAFIEGCALQVISEPSRFDVQKCSKAVASLLS